MPEDPRRRELGKFYGTILGILCLIWVLWGISHLWLELHAESEPTPASLVESAEKALSRGDGERARSEAELARLLIASRLETAAGEEKAALLRLAERTRAVEAGLSKASRSR